jgi:hypothetical protein
VSANKALSRTFGSKRIKVTRGWIKLHNEELHNLYSSPDILMIKPGRIRRARHVACMVEMRNSYKILVVKC